MAPRDDLLAEIAREEARLAALQADHEKCAARLDALRKQVFAAPAPAPPVVMLVATPTTTDAKITLFRSLFRGREDVFPRRWESKGKGTSGYSPVCANEWVVDVCWKKKGPDGHRRGTCGDCPNQAFTPVTDDEIRKHLRGEHVMGVYPMLKDETCWFLAADFDKEAWPEDVTAFRQTCEIHSVPVAMERSRSGNGAHAWIFFSAAIPAVVARRLGCFLVTETMARRHQLAMTSYDRLFPNQDTMPRGGFGNLIALPLQGRSKEAGNSLFVDDNFVPWPNQFACLASVRRMDVATATGIANDAARRGHVLGVGVNETPEEDAELPWDRPPSGRSRKPVITGPLPPSVKAVLCQQLFIQKAGLPSSLLNQLLRLAAFQNPEFYKRQAMRLSTATTPRVIACGQDQGDFLALPRGCMSAADEMLRDLGVKLDGEDKRVAGAPYEATFHGTLTPVQQQAADAMLAHDTGIFVAPPGIGKTVLGTYLVAARKVSTLVLVHRRPLLDQWMSQLAVFLDLEPGEIGQIGAGKRKPNGQLDVAMVQSLVRKDVVDDMVAGYGQVILDEAHHASALSFERLVAQVKGKYVVGLTATPHRRDGHHPILTMQLGPVRYEVDAKTELARRPFAHTLVVRETGFALPGAGDLGIQDLYTALVSDEKRNDLIFDDVVRALEGKRSPIVLTERREHLEYLAERLGKFTRNLVVLHGGMRAKEKRAQLARLAEIPEGEERLLIAIGRYVGEGFDDARLDTMFLALPVSWKGTLTQYVGRLHRLHPGKKEVRVYDYVDRAAPMLLKMFEKRLRGYRGIGYARGEAPLGIASVEEESVVEYDEEAIRETDDDE